MAFDEAVEEHEEIMRRTLAAEQQYPNSGRGALAKRFWMRVRDGVDSLRSKNCSKAAVDEHYRGDHAT